MPTIDPKGKLASLREAASPERLATWLRRDRMLAPVAPEPDALPTEGGDSAAAVARLVASDPLGSTQASFPGLAIDPDGIAVAALVLAACISAQVDDDDRAQRMGRVIDHKLNHFRSAVELDDVAPAEVLRDLCGPWTEAQKLTLLIELAALDPFAPYELTWEELHRDAGLAFIAETIGLTTADAQRVLDTFAAAARGHRDVSLQRIGLYTVLGAAALGGVGMLAAPMVGGALGAATGLSGAAATSHGLALLGGLAGTHSMTAGTWLVAQAGLVGGAVTGGLGSALQQLGASQAKAELMKLQVATKLVLVDLQRNDQAAHSVADSLHARLRELEALIKEATLLNDPDSPLVLDLRRNAAALEDAATWVEAIDLDPLTEIGFRVDVISEEVDQFRDALRQKSVLAELDDDERKQVAAEIDASFRTEAALDRWDFIAAAAIGLSAATIDAFAADIPKASPVTQALRSLAGDSDNWLSRVTKVPFDQSMGDGFLPNNHRVLTPGHDPLLGLVWGTWDILGSTMTRTTVDGELAVVDRLVRADVDTVGRALMIAVGHLLSDIGTHAGLPLPGWTALTMHQATAEQAVDAYVQGYDTWHLPAMSVSVAAVRAGTYAYRTVRARGDVDFAATVADGHESARVRAIEIVAFGVSTAAEIAQLAAGANPLSANYLQWSTLARRIVTEARSRSSSITETLLADIDANQTMLNRGWDLLVGESVAPDA